MSFFRAYQHLLPRAKAWRLTIDKNLRNFFLGLSQFPADIREFYDLIWVDRKAQETRQLAEMETEYGLREVGLTEQQRRDRLESRIKALGGQSPRYIQDTLQGEGFNVYVHEWWWPDPPDTIDITGTGTALDGRYYPVGEMNGKSYWTNTGTEFGSRQIYWNLTMWECVIVSFPTSETWTHPTSTDDNPPKTGWSISNLASPAPTLDYVDPITTRNPLLYLRRNQNEVDYINECGEAVAECGEPTAECGESSQPTGYPLVNRYISTKADTRSLCGEAQMECGEADAECGDFLSLVTQEKEYSVPIQPETFPYYLYIGGEVFPNKATIDSKRKEEFEELCLRICPLQLWLGMLIDYS